MQVKLKAFVGVDGKFVLASKLPDIPQYGGLHELVDDWVGYDDYLGDNVSQGLYEVTLELENHVIFNPFKDMSDVYFQLKEYKKLNIWSTLCHLILKRQ